MRKTLLALLLLTSGCASTSEKEVTICRGKPLAYDPVDKTQTENVYAGREVKYIEIDPDNRDDIKTLRKYCLDRHLLGCIVATQATTYIIWTKGCNGVKAHEMNHLRYGPKHVK